MKNIFVELTDSNGKKILLNVIHIAWIEPAKEGCSITSYLMYGSIPKKVKESYEIVLDKIKALDLPEIPH
jgi:uncharacterized protein YlzI (FlbEa/FlbD family)